MNKKRNLSKIPPKTRQHNGQIVSAARVHYSGPIPPPEQLLKYNEAVPNGAERILAMAERQSAHR